MSLLITGASSGIGEACAREFASRGHTLILVARRIERLRKLAAELRKRHRIEVKVFQLDVSSRKQVEAFARRQAKVLRQVSVLINNAGLARGMDPIQSGSLEDWDQMIDTNVKGVLYLTRLVLPAMIERGEGQVVNLGSVAGHWVYPKGNVYCATKFAVHALTEALRLDLSGTGIRVTEISPGMVNTEFSGVRLGDATKAASVYAGMTPLVGKDIAEAIVWCVERPRHVNIQEVVMYPTDQASPSLVHRRNPLR